MLSVQSLQNLGAAEPLEAALHIVIIPFQRLSPKNPAEKTEGRAENKTLSQREQMERKLAGIGFYDKCPKL